MLGLAFIFLALAAAAGILGFGVLAGAAAIIAKVFFALFTLAFLVTTIAPIVLGVHLARQ